MATLESWSRPKATSAARAIRSTGAENKFAGRIGIKFPRGASDTHVREHVAELAQGRFKARMLGRKPGGQFLRAFGQAVADAGVLVVDRRLVEQVLDIAVQ